MARRNSQPAKPKYRPRPKTKSGRRRRKRTRLERRRAAARKTAINPLGLPWWALLGGGALALYLATRKPASPNVVITKTTPQKPQVPGSQTFVGPMPQDFDLPPVPDPMSNYNYVRG